MPASSHYIPEGFGTVTPYLIVPGASELLDFMKQVFDAEEIICMRDPDGAVRHAAVRIGDSMVEFANSTEQWPAIPAALHIYVPDADAVYQRALEAGATSIYPPADHYYGGRSGGVKDASGNSWYIATHLEDVSEEELIRRQEAMKKETAE